jgi:hypothetical protein
MHLKCDASCAVRAAKDHTLMEQSSIATLLGKGRRFIPKALSTTEVQRACARLGYRLVGAFKRYVEGGYHEQRAQTMKEAGIRTWVPILLLEFCRSYVARFFKCQMQDGGLCKATNFFHQPLIYVSERLNSILSPMPARSAKLFLPCSRDQT